MMKRKLTRAVSGETMRLGRRDWNTVCETVERINGEDGGNGRNDVASHFDGGQITIRNGSLHVVPAFGVLAADKSLHEDRLPSEQLRFALNAGMEIGGKESTGSNDEILCIVQETLSPQKLGRGTVFGPTCVRVDVTNRTHLYARAVHGNVDHLESSDSGPVRLMVPAVRSGLQICYGILGVVPSAVVDSVVNAKELFPAAVYRNENDTYILCPGGLSENGSLKTVHALHVESRRMSTDLFGVLPTAMNNFDAVLADNGYGGPVLVCTPGDVDEGIRYPVQRYDFQQEEWSKSDTTQSLAGCPAYVHDGKVIVAGGRTAYHSAGPTQNAVSGTFGFAITPFRTIDPVTGAVATRIPLRKTSEFFSPQPESNVVNQQLRFLKQNFDGIAVNRGGVEFVAVGGVEQLGYQPRAVVSYAMNATGPLVDCQNAAVRLGDCEIFPDTPLPLGECRAVRIKRRRSGNMIVDGDWLLAIGGRYRDAEGNFQTHTRPWSLDLDNTAEGWRDDLFPEIPTPRWNAALSEPVATPVYDDEGNEVGTKERIFLIGGRNENGLLASIEALNIDTNTWETDWPGLNGRVPPPKETGENDA